MTDKNIHEIHFSSLKSAVCNLYQYDKGQIMLFDEKFKNGTEVQFENGMVKAIVDSQITIPDVVLENAGVSSAWIQIINDDNETTIYKITLSITPRAKKNDYVEPEDQQSFREEVQQMIEEAGRPTPEEIDPIVKDYLEKNPPQAYDDTEIREEIAEVNTSLSQKADKTEVPTTSDIDNRVQTYWNAHKSELKGDKGDKGADGTNGIDGKDGQNGKDGTNGKDGSDYVITSADYDAIADVVLTKLPSAESEDF